VKQFTLFELQQFEGYDKLKESLSEAEIQFFYNTPKELRGTLLPSKKIKCISYSKEHKSVLNGSLNDNGIDYLTNTNLSMLERVKLMIKDYSKREFHYNGETYSVPILGYKIGFNNRKKTLGICHSMRREINLSKWIIENSNNTINMWINTFLHEFAHAIDNNIRGKSDHSDKWRKIALSIGCNGNRLSDIYYNKTTSKYSSYCNNCGKTRPIYRLTKGMRNKEVACGNCCRKHNHGKFTKEYLLTVVKN